MINVSIPDNKMQKLADAVKMAGRNLAKETAIALNATTKKVKLEINRDIRTKLATNKKAVNRAIRITRVATKTKSSAGVSVRRGYRIPLKEFGAKQNAIGVTHRSVKGGGRETRIGAFQGPRPGLMKASWKGNVFKRVGKSRLPIEKQYGPTVLEIFLANKMQDEAKRLAARELRKQLIRRIKFNVLKASGTI